MPDSPYPLPPIPDKVAMRFYRRYWRYNAQYRARWDTTYPASGVGFAPPPVVYTLEAVNTSRASFGYPALASEWDAQESEADADPRGYPLPSEPHPFGLGNLGDILRLPIYATGGMILWRFWHLEIACLVMDARDTGTGGRGGRLHKT